MEDDAEGAFGDFKTVEYSVIALFLRDGIAGASYREFWLTEGVDREEDEGVED